MELIEVLQQMMARYVDGAGMTDLTVGTVTKAKPLEITVESSRLILPEAAIRLTASVVEKKLPILKHSHSSAEGTTGEALQTISCTEDGKPLPAQNGYIVLNRGLAAGDKVLLLRVQSGQCYVVLSRVFERGVANGNAAGGD